MRLVKSPEIYTFVGLASKGDDKKLIEFLCKQFPFLLGYFKEKTIISIFLQEVGMYN